MRIAVYPGSFDPPTFGHADLIGRARRIFDELVVAVGANFSKNHLFAYEERVDMLKEITADMPNVRVEAFSGLLVDFARTAGASVLVRGLRALSDFENEFQMALANRSLANIETVFLMTSSEHMFVSSSIVKEVASLGGDVSGMVPGLVCSRLALLESKD